MKRLIEGAFGLLWYINAYSMPNAVYRYQLNTYGLVGFYGILTNVGSNPSNIYGLVSLGWVLWHIKPYWL